MIRTIRLAAALLLAIQCAPSGAKLVVESPAQGIEAVAAAIAGARAKDAALPPAATDAERIVRMADLEQAPRLVMADFDLARLSETDKRAMWDGVWKLVIPIDEDNQAKLLGMVPAEGWFAFSKYGRSAAQAAFLIVQHSNEALWRRFLPRIEQMARSGEADGRAYALMFDRLALSEGRAQRYGSQMICTNSRWTVREPVEDMNAIDERRKEMGMETLAENLKRFENIC